MLAPTVFEINRKNQFSGASTLSRQPEEMKENVQHSAFLPMRCLIDSKSEKIISSPIHLSINTRTAKTIDYNFARVASTI